MSELPRAPRLEQAGGEATDSATSVESVALMRGRRELLIRHGADIYRLRITASNKLILTK